VAKDSPINSPFRYAGGKFYARKHILKHIPIHDYYIEPFAGGASIFFAKPIAKHNIINDLDKELMNVYYFLRTFPNELIQFLSEFPASRELHNYFKNEFIPRNDLERAGRWYYLNRTSFSGIMNMKNCYWGYGDKFSMRPQNWPRNILRSSEKLSSVVLSCLDFETIINNAPDNSFLFVDPPYYKADQDKFYSCIFSNEDHDRLLHTLYSNRNRLAFLLTYDNTEHIRQMYYWSNEMLDREWNYCISRTDDQKHGSQRVGNRYKGKEVFILNYEPSAIALSIP